MQTRSAIVLLGLRVAGIQDASSDTRVHCTLGFSKLMSLIIMDIYTTRWSTEIIHTSLIIFLQNDIISLHWLAMTVRPNTFLGLFKYLFLDMIVTENLSKVGVHIPENNPTELAVTFKQFLLLMEELNNFDEDIDEEKLMQYIK